MRFFFSGPRVFGVRPGVSFGREDFKGRQQARQSQQSKGEVIQGSFVYVVAGDHNMAKIGVTTNPAARIGQLRTGSAFPISYAFIGVTPGNGYDIEKTAHEILGHQRVVGEWFDVSPEAAMTAVMGAAAKLGQPLRPVDEATAAKAIQIAANGGQMPQTPRAPINGIAVFLKTLGYTVLYFILWAVMMFMFKIPETPFLWGCASVPFLAFAASYWEARRASL